MPLCKVIKPFRNTNGWRLGQIVDITNPDVLIQQGKVRLATAADKAKATRQAKKQAKAKAA